MIRSLALALVALVVPGTAAAQTPYLDFLSTGTACASAIADPSSGIPEMTVISSKCADDLMAMTPHPCYQHAWAALWAAMTISSTALERLDFDTLGSLTVFTDEFTEAIEGTGTTCAMELS